MTTQSNVIPVTTIDPTNKKRMTDEEMEVTLADQMSIFPNFIRPETGDECRFYELPLPLERQLVMCKVTRVAEMAAFVKLVEYGNIEGMILFAELSTRRIRSLCKEIRAGQYAVCMVIRVERDKGYIDLSRKRVTHEERYHFLAQYSKSKIIDSTLRKLSANHDIPREQLASKLAWPLYRQFPHCVDAFKSYINTKNTKIFESLDVSDTVRNSLYKIIEKKLTPQATRIKARIEVCCFGPKGIEAVKEALLEGLKQDKNEVSEVENNQMSDEKKNAKKTNPTQANGTVAAQTPSPQDDASHIKMMGLVQIRVVAPPIYDLSTQSIGKEHGINVLNRALQRIQTQITNEIKSEGGEYKLITKPEVQGTDENEINELDLMSGGEESSGEENESDTEDEYADETKAERKRRLAAGGGKKNREAEEDDGQEGQRVDEKKLFG